MATHACEMELGSAFDEEEDDDDSCEAIDQNESETIALLRSENQALKASFILMQEQFFILQNENIKLKSVVEGISNANENNGTPRKVPRANDMVNKKSNSPQLQSNMASSNMATVNIASNSKSSIANTSNANNTLDNNFGNSAAAVSVAENKNKKKILQAVNVNCKDINYLKDKKCVNYTVKQNNKNAPVKICINKAEKIPMIKQLITAKVSFHEYKWEAEKRSFIIRGLVGISEEDLPFIKHQLIMAGLPESISVSFFKSGFMRANPVIEHNTLVQLVLPPNTNTQIINEIKFIDHVAVKIEPLISSKTLQCKNCQRFGHSASGSMHTHRCVKCGANHFRSDCPRTNNKNIKLKCSNCNGEHTANNINECPAAQKYINSSHNSNSKLSPQHIAQSNNNIKFNNNSNNNNINNKHGSNNSNNFNKGNNFSNGNNGNNNKNIGSSIPSSFSSTSFTGLKLSSNSKINSNSNDRSIILNGICNNCTNNSHSFSYAQVAGGHINPRMESAGLNDIVSKLDMLINIVLKHEQLFVKMARHG